MSKIRRALRQVVDSLLAEDPDIPAEPLYGFAESPDAPEGAGYEPNPEAASASDPPVFGPVLKSETELSMWKRKALEYFKVIERIERERNGWIEMYRTQVSEHLTAQGMMERTLMMTRQVAERAIRMLNDVRKKQDMPPITDKAGLLPYDGEPVGLVEKYAARMMELQDAMPKNTDGLAERERIRTSGDGGSATDQLPADDG